MAGRQRTAKSGSYWGKYELDAYNIKVESQDAFAFSGINPLPEPMVPREVLTTLYVRNMADHSNAPSIIR